MFQVEKGWTVMFKVAKDWTVIPGRKGWKLMFQVEKAALSCSR
jgi:hypothetical protein